MSLSSSVKDKINELIENIIKRYLAKATDVPKANSGNPFVMALLKDFDPLIHRIHGLKTSLGSVMEEIAEIIARDAWGNDNIQRKFNTNITLPQNVFQEIDTIITSLSNPNVSSNYENEKKLILDACNNPSLETKECTYEFDLLLKDDTNIYILEMKTPDPNTTEVPGAKRRLLTALAWVYCETRNENINVHLALYYNNKYPNPYKNPKVHAYFDPAGGVLVQDDFWNFIGKNSSTCSTCSTFWELVDLFESYGKANEQRIWEGFSKLIEK